MRAIRWVPDARGRALVEASIELGETPPGRVRVRIEAFAIGAQDWSEAVSRPRCAGSHAAGVIERDRTGVAVEGERVILPICAVEPASPLSSTAPVAGDAALPSLVDPAGLWGDRVDVRIERVWRMPTGSSAPEAAAVLRELPLAWQGLHCEASLQPGEDLCVFGAASAAGVMAVQLGRRFGARVIAVVDAVEHVEPIRELGADDVVQIANQNPGKEIAKLTARRGADVVFVASGVDTVLLEQASASRARLLFSAPNPRDPGPLIARGRRLIALRAPDRPDLAAALEWVERGQVRPVVDAVFPLSESSRAVARGQGGAGLGAVVVVVGE